MTDILTNSTVINLDISIWTGKAKLQRTEIDDSGLPPEGLVTLGSKRLFDPVKLRRFHGIKSSAFAACNRYGVRFLGGWLVDNDYLADLTGKLSGYRTLWDDELREFRANYSKDCHDWLARNPEWAAILRSAMPDPTEIGRRFNFGWQVFNVLPAPTATYGDQTDDELGVVPSRAMEKMAQAITEALPTYAKREFRAAPLRKLAEMCRVVSFTSPEIARLGDVLEKLESVADNSIISMVLGKLSTANGIAALCDPDMTAREIIDSVSIPSVPPVQPSVVPMEAPVLPVDVDGLIARATSVLRGPMKDLVSDMVPQAAHDEVTPLAPEEKADKNRQAVDSMLGMIDSGGLW